MGRLDGETRTLLDTQDWKGIAATLLDYAIFKVSASFFRSGRRNLPGGNEIKDVVAGAIESVLCGARKWDPAKQPDIVEYLKAVVDSRVSHLITSYEHIHRQHESGGLDESDGSDIMTSQVDASQDPLSEVIASEQWECLKRVAVDDEEMQMVIYCFEEGVVGRSEIAASLSWDLSCVDNTLKRIRRHMKKCVE